MIREWGWVESISIVIHIRFYHIFHSGFSCDFMSPDACIHKLDWSKYESIFNVIVMLAFVFQMMKEGKFVFQRFVENYYWSSFIVLLAVFWIIKLLKPWNAIEFILPRFAILSTTSMEISYATKNLVLIFSIFLFSNFRPVQNDQVFCFCCLSWIIVIINVYKSHNTYIRFQHGIFFS